MTNEVIQIGPDLFFLIFIHFFVFALFLSLILFLVFFFPVLFDLFLICVICACVLEIILDGWRRRGRCRHAQQ